MSETPSPALSRDPLTKRALELDALAAILPMDRRDRLAEILTDDDVATLKHLAKEGMGENSLRALASDLAYLEAWVLAAAGTPLPWPAPEARALKFVAHHLWDPARRDTDPGHGMPEHGRRRFCARRGCCARRARTRPRRCAGACPVGRPCIIGKVWPVPSDRRRCVRRSGWRCAQWRGRGPGRAKKRLPRMCSKGCSRRANPTGLLDARDAALLLVAFASGGRRRSEVAGLRFEQLIAEAPVPSDPSDPKSAALPCLSIRLGRTKTTEADTAARVFLVGRPVAVLREWLARADIIKGPVFRAIDQWGGLDDKAMTPQSVNGILKRRIALAGLDPKAFSAHGLRAGYLTEAARRGVSLPEAMQQSQHRSVQQAASYYNEAERRQGRAARLVE